MSNIRTAAINAQNTFTAPLKIEKGKYNTSVWGTFVATVVTQRSFDGGNTWLDVASVTAAKETVGEDAEGALYRVGVKTAGFTSGTVNVRIGQ